MADERFLEWTEQYAVGHQGIDHDHQQLFAIVSRLQQAIALGDATDVIACILSDLAEYVGSHFSREELLMAQTHYPEMNDHIEQHWQLTQQLSQLVFEFETGERLMPDHTLMFLRDWLKDHTTSADRRLGDHLRRLVVDGVTVGGK